MRRLIRPEKARRAAEEERARVAKDAERIRERCQTLAGFAREAWHVLEPNTPLVWNWHLDALCAHLEAVNGHVERLIGSIRRECLDHVVILGEVHLRRILATYASYYNEHRTHRSLAKDTPLHRVIERLGTVTSRPLLGDLHHQYCRI